MNLEKYDLLHITSPPTHFFFSLKKLIKKKQKRFDLKGGLSLNNVGINRIVIKFQKI